MLWLILGITCIIIDFFFLQSLVLLFFGLGALTTALADGYNLVVNFEQQAITFLASASFWCLVLWRPLKKLKRKKAFNSIIGHSLYLTDAQLQPGKVGSGKWSGTHVRIMLSEDSKPAKIGDKLKIISIEGITFKVTNREE